MSFLDYNILIQRVMKPSIYDTVFQKTVDDLTAIFGVNESVYEGDRITESFKTSITTSAGAYTKADVNPPSFDQEFVKPYWTKVQYHETAEVSKIDLSNKKGEGPRIQMVRDALDTAADNLKSKVFDGCMTQLKSDIDATGAYSDASLSRTTYPTLASYEEATDTAITIDLMRGARNATHLNKSRSPRSSYVWLMEQEVMDVFEPLAAAQSTWNIEQPGMDSEIDAGIRPIASWEGSKVYVVPGMTTGDVFYIRKQDVLFAPHRTFEIEPDPSTGRDTLKWTLRMGLNLHIVNPGWQAKMTDKD
jgi:hypothetical protein